MKSNAILIPARYSSTRFPGKPLALLDGVPMIMRVFDTCHRTGYDTYVLTDDTRIGKLFDDKHVIYTKDCLNGTERCSQALEFTNYDQYINVQGDMPDITVEMIERVKYFLDCYPVTTLHTDLSQDKIDDPNTVKGITAKDNLIWCGRNIKGYGVHHLGVYGYNRTSLQIYPNLDIPIEEEIEKLEQLRWLKNGWQIGSFHVQYKGIEINSPEDVEQWHSKNSH